MGCCWGPGGKGAGTAVAFACAACCCCCCCCSCCSRCCCSACCAACLLLSRLRCEVTASSSTQQCLSGLLCQHGMLQHADTCCKAAFVTRGPDKTCSACLLTYSQSLQALPRTLSATAQPGGSAGEFNFPYTSLLARSVRGLGCTCNKAVRALADHRKVQQSIPWLSSRGCRSNRCCRS